MVNNHIAILLDENKLVFQPGETISGELWIYTGKGIILRSARVELHGVGRVSFYRSKTNYKRTETYLDCKSILLGEGKSGMLLKCHTIHERFLYYHKSLIRNVRSSRN